MPPAIQYDLINAALRACFAGMKVPPIGTALPDRAVLSWIRSNGTPAISTRIEVDGRGYTVAMVHFGPQLWIGGNWNTDEPALRGGEVLAAVRHVFSLPRPADDPGVDFDQPRPAVGEGDGDVGSPSTPTRGGGQAQGALF